MIRAEKLVKTFVTGDRHLTVLKGLDLAIDAGEFVAIIGRSGSGKSTLLYQLSLLDHPTSGKVYIDSVEMTDVPNGERTAVRLNSLGYVFQDYALVPELSAFENVLIPLLMQGVDPSHARRTALDMLEKVGLKDRARNLPNQLSGGEQQRVSIARAIGHNPKILFADEPTANLDNDTALEVLRIFQNLHRDGQTIVMVTHEREYAKMTDRVVTLFDGVITEDIPSRDF